MTEHIENAARCTSESRALRLYISSWEIECHAPKPVLGEMMPECVVGLIPAGRDPGWQDLDEDIDTALIPPTLLQVLGLSPGVHRGHLYGDFHASSGQSISPGVALRTRIVALDRRLEQQGEHQVWMAVPGSVRMREVHGVDWCFSNHYPPNDANLGTVCSGVDDGLLVDLLPM